MSPCFFGILEREKAYVICREMNKALEAANFPYKKIIKGFQQDGRIVSAIDSDGKKRSQHPKSVNGIVSRVYILNLPDQNRQDHTKLTPVQIELPTRWQKSS